MKMTDESFLAAMHRKSSSPSGAAGLQDADPLTVALRIEDLRSALLVSTSNAVSLNRRTTKQERRAS